MQRYWVWCWVKDELYEYGHDSLEAAEAGYRHALQAWPRWYTKIELVEVTTKVLKVQS